MSYVAIRSEGGLLPEDVIRRAVEERGLGGQRPADFGFRSERQLSDEIAAAWSAALEYWEAFQARLSRMPEGQSLTSATREMWLLPVLEALGYRLAFQRAAAEAGGTAFSVSHRAGEGAHAPPVHLVAWDQELDLRARERLRERSPQALLQDYLNRSEHLWGMVANGRRLRLVRQSPRISRPAYLEIDLHAMMAAGRFDEFVVFYRLCHRSRLPQGAEDQGECWLERYHQESVAQGGRVRERLRDGVEAALRHLGSGFLAHPQNGPLREALAGGALSEVGFYRELLRLVYRLLFLMVAEERQLLVPDPASHPRALRVYFKVFSVERLRRLAEGPVEGGDHGDLWLGLQDTFRLLSDDAEGARVLDIPPLNGDLFGPRAMPHLEGTRLYNRVLLEAVRSLSLFRDEGVLRRVNYAALDVEELGSVYESLLDYAPQVRAEGGGHVFDLVPGTERKSTGSYYTRPELVKELVESALVPVVEERLREAGPDPGSREQAILTLAVCDPACGSGHFLLEAGRRLARELARVRTGEEEPTPQAFRHAVRDVIESCLYGVDVNPLAVDLCKLALWIEGHNAGQPLSFLDHRIRCGNSLLGVLSLDVLKAGVPDEAYTALTGDDRAVVNRLRRKNRAEARNLAQLRLPSEESGPGGAVEALAEVQLELAALPQRTAAQVRELATKYEKSRGEGTDWWRAVAAANLWTAAFLIPRTGRNEGLVPTSLDVVDLLRGDPVSKAKVDRANEVALRHRVFHWPLEFPEVFAGGGFDVVLGNPPWEKMQFEDKAFFATRAPEIATAENKASRRRMIEQLQVENARLWQEFLTAERDAEAHGNFVRGCGRYPLTGHGIRHLNTYALFAELGFFLLGKGGRMGMVMPTGIATDHSYRGFFGHVTEEAALASLFDFENRQGLFPAVDSRQKFCLLTLSRSQVSHPRFAFFCQRVEDLQSPLRVFSLTPNDLLLFNPNTRTTPIFRTSVDAELTRKIYRRVPVLIDRRRGSNPWKIHFSQMINMSDDSHLFSDSPAPGRVPLYEAKLFHQFDHRWATYVGREARDVLTDEKADPAFSITPRYWVDESEMIKRVPVEWPYRWFLAFRDVARATDERTVIATVLPWSTVGHTAPLWLATSLPSHLTCLLANLNSIVLDYVARQKIGGTHLTFFYVEQLPVLSSSEYSDQDVSFIAPRVLELIYTSHDLAPFARDLGFEGPPFPWHEERRALLRAELDAYYAHLYGLDRDELRYILDPQDMYGEGFPGETFRVLKENETRAFGFYRTRDLVLAAYDRLADRFEGRLRKEA